MEVQLKLWKSNRCATLPTCNWLLQVPFLFWLIEGAGAKISQVLVLVYVFGAMVSIARCSFIIARMRVGLNTQVRTYGCNAQFWWQMQRIFFCRGPFGQMHPMYGNIRPVRTHPNKKGIKDFKQKKNAPFFSTSVRPIHQNCFSSWHHRIRVSACAIPWAWYPAAFAKHFIEKIGAIECITKGIFSIKCKTKVLYEMTLLYIKDQKWLIFAHQKWWTIQCDPKLPCHPIALIMYSGQRYEMRM